MSHLDALDPRGLALGVFDEEFGLQPTNFSVKPVHVANGLARALTGRTYDTTALAQTLRRWVRAQRRGLDEERNPTGKVLERYAVAFTTGVDADHARVDALRALARDVLGADGAVFDQPDKTSYTLASGLFASPDPSDNRAGAFLAALITAGGRGDAADLLIELLTDDSDPFTTLAKPLLALAEARPVRPPDPAEAQALDRLVAVDGGGRLTSPRLRALREGFDRLARFERAEGSKVNSLRRRVLFGCFAVHVHMIARWSEVRPGAPHPPITLDMFDGARIPLRDASRASLRAAKDAIEGLLSERFQHTFTHLDEEAAQRLLSSLPNRESSAVGSAYAALRSGAGVSPNNAMAEAYLEVSIRALRGHPLNFLTELGRRAGYLTPWANQGRQGKLQKRYSATAELLETLVAATVEANEELIDFGTFLDRLRCNFGIVAGRARDDEIIRNNNVNGGEWTAPTSIAEEDLRRNVEALRIAVLETGYATEYADGQTVVTSTPEAGAVR